MSHKRKDNGEGSGECRKKQKQQNSFEEYRQSYITNTPWRNNVEAKINSAAPFNFFLTKVTDSFNTYSEDLTISFPELLDTSLGDLESSLHINFMIELPWLLAQYMVVGHRNPSMTILYGEEDDDLKNPPSHLSINTVRVKSPYPFGHHHTKMSIFSYRDKSIRVAVYTANLIESDWDNRTQGVWVSPRCSYLGDDVPINEGESPTYFKCDLIKYLNSYHKTELHNWIKKIQKTDFSEIKVFLVASVPGNDIGSCFGHKKLSKVIKENVKLVDPQNWKYVAQCSSIGSLGSTPETWLCGDFLRSLCGQRSTARDVSVVYPCIRNVKDSHDGMLGGACLPYSSKTHQKQPWLRRYMHQWKSDSRFRTKAVPHIKTYTCVSNDNTRMAWFLLTSANLSKAAWGTSLKDGSIRPLSYEAGVLFIPSILIGKDWFEIKPNGDFTSNHFPIPYTLPLEKYENTDEIFFYDVCFRD